MTIIFLTIIAILLFLILIILDNIKDKLGIILNKE